MTTSRTDQAPLWWQSGVIYQIYPRSFQDSNGDGIGDLPGIIDRLDYFRETMPIDAIWLSPIFPSPMADFGYDVADYTDIDPMFGDLADFDRLVAQTHARRLRLIIDFVPNHTSDRHPWFLESRTSRQNPKRDWYVWAPPRPDGSPPNNWTSVFGGSAWEFDAATGQYYLHSFLKEQPDLNWRNSAVKHAMFDVMRFWLDRGVDGFRIDALLHIMKDPEFRDNPSHRAETAAASRPDDLQIHLHDKAHPDIHSVLRELRQVVDEYEAKSPRVAIGEIHVFDPVEWASYYGPRLDELHMPFNFSLLFAPWSASSIKSLIEGAEAALPPGGWPNYVLGNHDVHRIVSRIGPEQARVAMMLLLTLRGTPTLYCGDELGMQDVPIPPDEIQDPFGILTPGQTRDPERTPMQWDTSATAGFCPENVKPWLPLSPDHTTINVATERRDPHSMLSLTRSLLDLRRSNDTLQAGDYRSIDGVPSDCLVYVRNDGKRAFLIALNFKAEQRTLHLPVGTGHVRISTAMDRTGEVDLADLQLRPNEGCLVAIDLPWSGFQRATGQANE